jgi:hypothetical protein
MWFGSLECNTLHPRENEVILLKSGLARVSLSLPPFFLGPCGLAPTQAFYSSRLGSYNKSQGPISGPRAGRTLCYRAPMARSSK